MGTDTLDDQDKDLFNSDSPENKRYSELSAKTDRSVDEEKELDKLKANYRRSAKEEIKFLRSSLAEAERKHGQASEEAKKLREEMESLKEDVEQIKTKRSPEVVEQTATFGGKQYYTDTALRSLIDTGKMSETEAWQHQRARDKAEIKDEILREQEVREEANERKHAVAAEAKKVLQKYPHFDKNHPKFNPDEPLYKKTVEIYNKGMHSVAAAVELAEEILGFKAKGPDLSDELSLRGTGAPGDSRQKDEKIELSKDEEEVAVRTYTMGSAEFTTNPRTGKTYTREEAIEKFRQAKTKRIKSRRVV